MEKRTVDCFSCKAKIEILVYPSPWTCIPLDCPICHSIIDVEKCHWHESARVIETSN